LFNTYERIFGQVEKYGRTYFLVWVELGAVFGVYWDGLGFCKHNFTRIFSGLERIERIGVG
jgi:hypothetical protein